MRIVLGTARQLESGVDKRLAVLLTCVRHNAQRVDPLRTFCAGPGHDVTAAPDPSRTTATAHVYMSTIIQANHHIKSQIPDCSLP
jgi:hypothetical protein